MKPPLYTLAEIAKELHITMAQLRGAMGNKKNPPPKPVSINRKYYVKEQFINWYRSR